MNQKSLDSFNSEPWMEKLSIKENTIGIWDNEDEINEKLKKKKLMRGTLIHQILSKIFNVKDKYAELLEKMGMDMSLAGKVSELKAPMPGLVLDILVNEGDEVTADQPLMILEAMKMENVIKSPTDGVVKSINITKSKSVEKNQVLISFD